MVGVRSLSIGLSIALVVCTGVLVGTLSITTGQKTTADAREAGDRGVAATLASGDKDIRQMAARYLKATTEGVERAMAEVLGKAETAIHTLRRFGETVPPEWMTANGTNEYLDTTLRMAMRQVLAANYPIVAATTWRWGYLDGVLASSRFDYTQAYSPNPDDLWAAFETQPVPGMGVGPSPYAVIAAADERGRMKDIDKPCPLLNTGMPPNLAEEAFGLCVLPRAVLYADDSIDHANMMDNVRYSASSGRPLYPANEVTFGETYSFLTWIYSGVHIPVEHPKHIQPGAQRSVNRLGYFTLSLDMKYVSDVFLSVNVPAGAILYCVEKNPWTESVGMLVATNYGRLISSAVYYLQGYSLPGIESLNAVNHTFTENTTELSPIAHHARHIFAAFPTHYEDAAVATNDRGEFLEWTLPTNGTADGATTTTTYWYTVLHMKYANLNWYISMLVPRSSIMDAIDASVAAVQAQREQDKEDADEFEKRSLLITVVVTVVVACVLMGVSAVVTNKILSPLMGLERDMACVAVMNVEAVDLGGEMSALSEVRGMEESFRTMVKNLVEYKQYMPQSVLVTDTEGEEDNATSSGLQGAQDSRSRLSKMSKTSSNTQSAAASRVNGAETTGAVGTAGGARRTSAHDGVAAARAMLLAQADLRRKQITITAFNIRGFLATAGDLRDVEFQDMYANVLTILLAAMKQYRGVCDTFAGDRFMIAHNAFINQATHKVSAVQEALQVRKRLLAMKIKDGMHPLSVSFAACTGEARVGQMGCTGMKKVTITSAVIPWAAALEGYNKVRGYGGVVDGFLAVDAAASIVLRKTDVAVYTKRTARVATKGNPEADGAADKELAIGVYEVVREREVNNDEWMYQLENSTNQEDPYVKWASMFDALVAGRQEDARKLFGTVDASVCSGAERDRIAALVAAGGCEAVVLDLHVPATMPRVPAVLSPDDIKV